MRNLSLTGLGAAVAAGAVLASGAAFAQERPRYIPTRDVTVQYQVSASQQGAPANIVVHISAAGQVRIEAAERGVVLYDTTSGRARWVLPNGGAYLDLPVGNSLAGALIPPPDASFTRGARHTVAGLSCTEWRVAMPRGSGTACVTADGVILSGQGSDTRGHSGSIVATNVSYAAQPASLFAPPPDAQRIDLPRNLSFARPKP